MKLLIPLLFVLMNVISSKNSYCKDSKKILIDTDTAMTSWIGLDVDDNLAVAFASSSPCIEIVGITVTHGNSPLYFTCPEAKKLMASLNLKSIDVKCGSGYFSNFKDKENESEASKFISEKINQYPNEIVLISLGALTNIASAFYHHPEIVTKLRDLIIMGGSFTGPELNFIADTKAANYILNVNITKAIITMQLCQNVVFSKLDVEYLANEKCKNSYAYRNINILRRHATFMGWMNPILMNDCPVPGLSSTGFHPWDIIAIAYVTDFEEIFKHYNTECMLLQVNWNTTGDKVDCNVNNSIRVPTLLNTEKFIEIMKERLCNA